jgi:hypothetical protein
MSYIKLKVNNQAGVSLVQIMVAFALLGVLSVMLMNLTEQAQKQGVTALANADVQEFVGHMNSILSNKSYCNNTLGPVKLGDTIGTLRYSDDPEAEPFATAGQQYKKTKVQVVEMKVEAYDSTKDVIDTNGEINLRFKITLTKLGKNIIGGKQFVKEWNPRVMMGEIIHQPADYCEIAKDKCLARSANAKIMDNDTDEFSTADEDKEDEWCSQMVDDSTSPPTNYATVTCFVPATSSNISTSVIHKCL